MSSTIPSIVLAANQLNYIAMMFIRCYCYIVIPLGLIGHLLSIFVFTRPTLRTNPCTSHFLAATIVGLLNTCYVLPIRMVQSAFVDTDPGAYSVIFCKVTWYTLNTLRYLYTIRYFLKTMFFFVLQRIELLVYCISMY